MLTVNQILHRQFIRSPLWKGIRHNALNFHGSKCAVCGKYATDVHHKNYDRFGGGELLSDLQVLCRGCHDAKHSAARCCGMRQRRHRARWVFAEAAFRCLTQDQKRQLSRQFSIVPCLMFVRLKKHRGLMLAMQRMLSVMIIECNWKRLRRMERKKEQRRSNRNLINLIMRFSADEAMDMSMLSNNVKRFGH